MRCVNPYLPLATSVPFGCTQCLPCRINRRRQWTFRMLLESFKHGDSSFVTLTYAENPGSTSTGCGVCKDGCKRCNCSSHSKSLEPAHARNFLKRLRKILGSEKIRYFLVGEYGKETLRPHFHAILFGLPQLTAGGLNGLSGVVRSAWRCGHTYVGDANIDSMQYVAGYVTKKLASTEMPLAPKVLGEPRRYVDGRIAEFSRMSLRPGIGAYAADDIARVVDTPFGLRELIDSGDVPATLKMGGKSLPLARYIRGKIREKLGMDKKAPEKAQRLYSLQMMDVFNEARSNPKLMAGCVSRADLWKRLNSAKAVSLEARYKMFESAHKI